MAKATLNLQDYTISQTTLDQVFVNFASQEGRDCSLDGANGSVGAKQRIVDGQLPYLNRRIAGIQVNETRFNESANGASRTANDELMQQSPSNLMKCSTVYRAAESGQLRPIELNPKLSQSVIRQLPGSHLKQSARAGKKSSQPTKHRLKQPTNFSHFTLGNQVALNNQINLGTQTAQNGATPPTALYFNRPQPQIAANFSGLAYPLNYLHSSNLYCSIGRPPNPSAHLYSSPSVQQPKWKFKQKFSMD